MSTLHELFPGYYPLSPNQLAAFRRWCTFALDANVLLNLYSYRRKTRKQFLEILSALKGRIWIPHQAAYEYEKNRVSRIVYQKTLSERVRDILSEAVGSLTKMGDQLREFAHQQHHPFFVLEEVRERLRSAVNAISEDLKEKEALHMKLLTSDPIREFLDNTLSERIGQAFAADELERIYDEAAKRYERQQPPGYKDVKGKQGVEKYGDVVLWYQLINLARDTGRSVFLVTDDVKEDWWSQKQGLELSPRAELVHEMNEKAGVRFHIIRSFDFYEWASTNLKRKISSDAIKEARQSAEIPRFDFLALQRAMPDVIKAIREVVLIPGAFQRQIRELVELTGAGGDAIQRQVEAIRRSLPSYDQLLKATFSPEWLEQVRRLLYWTPCIPDSTLEEGRDEEQESHSTDEDGPDNNANPEPR